MLSSNCGFFLNSTNNRHPFSSKLRIRKRGGFLDESKIANLITVIKKHCCDSSLLLFAVITAVGVNRTDKYRTLGFGLGVLRNNLRRGKINVESVHQYFEHSVGLTGFKSLSKRTEKSLFVN